MTVPEAIGADRSPTVPAMTPVPSRPEQIGTPCIDGTVLSAADVERTADKASAQRTAIRRAVYAVAGHAADAGECRDLLDMIGIDLTKARAARGSGRARVQ